MSDNDNYNDGSENSEAVEQREIRNVLTETRIFMKKIEFDNADGSYYIGNCNLNLNLRNTVLRFMPPGEDDGDAEIVIVNSTYNNLEFEDHMSDEDFKYYLHGLCNMDINAMHTVLKFFPNRYGEHNVLVINQTQPRGDGKKISNPCEFKIFLRKKDLENNQ